MIGTVTKIIAIMVLLLLLTSAGFNVYLAIKDHTLSDKVTSLNTENSTLKTNLTEAQTTILNQNTAILNANKKSVDAQAKFDDLNNQLTDQKTKDAKLIADLKKQPAPKTCQDSLKYLNQELEIFQW